jgi:undecaprenyl-diphosphatase
VGLNEDVFLALNGAGNPLLDPVMVAFAVAGLFPLTFVWAIPLWFRGRRAEAIDFVLVLTLAEASAFVLKLAFAVHRPEGLGTVLEAPFDDRSDLSFPSGHTTRAFVAAAFVALSLKDWRWGAPLLAYASVMGLSRIYVGAHWPSDVLGGAVLGIAWAVGFERLATRDSYRRFRDAVLGRLGRGDGPPVGPTP